MQSNETRHILFFLHNSVSELYVGLPILWFLKKHMDVKIHFVSEDKKILERLKVQDSYVKIMEELGEFHFGNVKVLNLLGYMFFTQKNIISFSCFSGMKKIEKVFYFLLKKLKKVFYPHSFALYPSGEYIKGDQYKKLLDDRQNDFKKRFGVNYNYLLLNREDEKKFYSLRGWSEEKLIAIVPFGYYEEWISKLNLYEKRKSDDKIRVFVALRNYNKHALTKENYEVLIEHLFNVFKEFKNFDFIVKPHPRQTDINTLQKKLQIYDNVLVSNQSPYEIIKQSDLTVALWGSVIQDSIALDTPAVEFHIHHTSHPQVYKNSDGEFVSLYEAYGIVDRLDNAKDLIEYLNSLDKDKLEKIYSKQKKLINEIYNLNDDKEIDKMVNIFENIFNTETKFMTKFKELVS